ncbi:hypothetical protein Prudu_003733 [Prunus dulcis]|uniref:Uncharacterized protein n=1 Tax=Prunus dulcis TaxID=3755 RepID=A0A4Y1QTS1_PRUDU|nr:hypothetical protein Prudu_003733 [Prunus dulcis]
MRKGAKRKVSQREDNKENSTKPDNHKEHPSKATTRSKRVKASHPESEPEYLEEPRNLEDLWKAAFPVGTEWDQLDAVYRFKWDFSNLEQAFEEGASCLDWEQQSLSLWWYGASTSSFQG